MKLMWFRNDLRVADNPALFHACSDGDPVTALYIITPTQWQQHDMAAIRVDFILRTLQALSTDLAELNIPLCILTVADFAAVPNALLTFCQQHKINGVFWNQEYEWNERQRDHACTVQLDQAGLALGIFEDQCLIAPHRIKTGTGAWYKVFTPFKKNWQSQLDQHPPELYPIPDPCPLHGLPTAAIPTHVAGFDPIDATRQALWPAGSTVALDRLEQFIEHGLWQYNSRRNRPDLEDGTSRLSAYLAVGALGNRQCYVAAQRHLSTQGDHSEAAQWISELCWRDFYRHVLVGFPQVSRGQAFDAKTDAKIAWSYHVSHFQAWKDGKTGIPIVDAAMRALKAEGFMHNRLRMVTAMFLTKNLLIDWRWGEQYFCQQLIDGDLASNNGGWQWSASVGTDAAPYFRVMNAMTQGQTHDPQGDYIRRWVPELSHLGPESIHQPRVLACTRQYVPPMVDLKLSRAQAIAAFQGHPPD